MSIELKNTRIINFFNERPDMDIESMILKFIDIMETLQENMNKTLNNSNVLEILDNLKQMNAKIDKTEESNKCNIDRAITSFKAENHLSLSGLMHILKQEMNDEIKNSMSISMIEKLEPALREKLREQQVQLVGTTIQKFEGLFDNKLNGLRENSNKSNEILSNQNERLNNFLNKFENSSKKGAMSENALYGTLCELYPKAEINSVGQTKETGDIMLIRHQKPKVLVENKNWNRPVVQTEVAKFIRDIEVQKCCGIFLSQNTAITTKENYEINIHDGNILVYVHEVNNDPEKIKIAIDIVDSFSDMLREIERQEESGLDINTISKEVTDHINVEYENLVSQKNSIIKLAKDFNQRLIKQLEDFSMPSLENYLSQKYSKASSSKYSCEYCGFIGKNQQARAAHMRGCVEKKKIDEKRFKKSDDQKLEISIETN